MQTLKQFLIQESVESTFKNDDEREDYLADLEQFLEEWRDRIPEESALGRGLARLFKLRLGKFDKVLLDPEFVAAVKKAEEAGKAPDRRAVLRMLAKHDLM